MALKTADNNFGVAKFIVSAAYSNGCTHTTIASALTDASSGDTIFVRTGTYTENLTLKAGVNICAFDGDGVTPTVTIVGKCSFSSTGTVSISGIRLKTNSDYFLAVTGSAASIVNLLNCYFECANSTGISFTTSNTSARIKFINCKGDITTTGITFFAISGTGTAIFDYCRIDNSGASTTQSTISSGTIAFNYTNIAFPIATSGTGSFTCNFSDLNTAAQNVTPLTLDGSPANPDTANESHFVGGSATAIVVNVGIQLRTCNVYSTNANAISGTGTLTIGSVVFSGTSSSVSCTVTGSQMLMTGQISLIDRVNIMSNSGSPNGSVTAPKGSLYLRTDGSSTSTRAYINTNGGTTWTAITTVA